MSSINGNVQKWIMISLIMIIMMIRLSSETTLSIDTDSDDIKVYYEQRKDNVDNLSIKLVRGRFGVPERNFVIVEKLVVDGAGVSQSLIECLKESLSKFSDGNQMIVKIGLRSGVDHDVGVNWNFYSCSFCYWLYCI